ncbi:hypothetical protein GVN16_05500 [Emticicia sp. CRIBPO]|uniref:nucleotidyltransferase family protein n=1 Tax=Emticicia sp. CRIBPO TaxID=2683258 RepID=UPI0014128C75|nr:nucleotidyltransferase family protein [Emticicia sp. CRIBPO]NBA85204.1 hypothetical protein [Emticicia sp. CRIBPO]
MKHRLKHIGGHFPDHQQTLLLKAALLDKSEAAACFEAWLQSHSLAYLRPGSATFLSDFMDTLDLGSQRMLPLVIHNLGEDAHPYFKFLSGIRKNYWVKTKQILHNAQKVRNTLEQNGIPCILIKGLDLATRYYHNDTLRPMSDGDILVPFAFRSQALEIARKGLKISAYDHSMKDFLHGIHLRFDRQEADADLHWNIFKEYPDSSTASDFIWDKLTEVKTSIGIDKRMQDTHAFFVSLVHGRNFGVVSPFRWVADTMMVYRNAGHLDWDEMLDLCQRFHFKPFIKRAFPYLVKEFGMKVPEGFMTSLEEMPAGQLEESYYRAFSQSFNQGNLVSRIWGNFRNRLIFYRLFVKENHGSVFSYFVAWYTGVMKAKLSPEIR